MMMRIVVVVMMMIMMMRNMELMTKVFLTKNPSQELLAKIGWVGLQYIG